jgi:uncharacterized membrane protein YdjX (TVP38/TMEM64 family)
MNPIADLVTRFDEFGRWAPLLFVLAYVVGSVAFVPGTLLTLAAGAVFGVSRGVPLVFTGAVLGSCAAFGVARGVARRPVERWLAHDRRAAAIARALRGQGFKIIVLMHLSPVIPYNVLNYVCGASTIRFRDFLLGTIGMLPLIVVYTYYGKVVGDVAAIAAGRGLPRGPEYYVILAVGVAATVALTIVITRAAKRALEPPPDR